LLEKDWLEGKPSPLKPQASRVCRSDSPATRSAILLRPELWIMTTQTTFFVFFDGSFWRLLVERRCDGLLSIASYVFSEEPSDAAAYRWWLTSSSSLEYSPPTPSFARPADSSSTSRPKKVRRAAKEIQRAPVSPEIRVAAQAERNRRRSSMKAVRKQQHLAFQEAKRAKRIQKAREKMRGH
jgi:hypothetical protein